MLCLPFLGSNSDWSRLENDVTVSCLRNSSIYLYSEAWTATHVSYEVTSYNIVEFVIFAYYVMISYEEIEIFSS